MPAFAAVIHLFFNGLVQFLLLPLVLSLAVWAGLPYLVFDADWKTVAVSAWAILSSNDQQWHTILGRPWAVGTLLMAWLFAG
ncbi:hypothetical protein [Paucibacter sp. XJ19-41]|uniref:hypothetical protein n=1 Tax=Paucibacter sp. XJ19-41 TaxID=2927824 RepID=UPI00234B86AF|nr:hypothetical protein [Paucibacter sp. XJ19-41]MDC6167869.1 hypothetical protein [Paucibacter sp. XJ19-41]